MKPLPPELIDGAIAFLGAIFGWILKVLHSKTTAPK